MRTSILAFVFAAVMAACAGGGTDPGDPTPDAPSNNTPVCGDGTCAGPEVGVCPQDCGNATAVCGNGTCEAGEAGVCNQDCPPAGPVCGDNVCDMNGGENSTNCPGDCGGNQGGTCPADPFACFTCAIDGTGCPAGHDMTSCTECLFGGL
jgi:hypothetical protein